jgi:hypothetical protein
MSTFVAVNTYTHAVTHVTGHLLNSLKVVIRLSGLSPEKLTSEWESLERGVCRWLETHHLEGLHLEVYDPTSDKIVGRWDFVISYGFTGDGDFWVDADAIRYHIQKQGIWPASCNYRIIATTKEGRPDVWGWTTTTFRSTAGFVKQSIGTTIDASGLSAGTGYWRRATA